jgi:hypothetical protein
VPFRSCFVCVLLGVSKNGENEQKIATIIGIFHQIPAASPKFIDILCRLVLQTEKSLLVEASSPFREPLLKFLLRFPQETIDLFLHDNNIKVMCLSRNMLTSALYVRCFPIHTHPAESFMVFEASFSASLWKCLWITMTRDDDDD